MGIDLRFFEKDRVWIVIPLVLLTRIKLESSRGWGFLLGLKVLRGSFGCVCFLSYSIGVGTCLESWAGGR